VADPWQTNCQKVWREHGEVMKEEATAADVATRGTPWKKETPA